jgi:hypothetical protein
MALEYLPFILMLFALYTAAGGISVEGRLHGSPHVNTSILALGAAIANVIGTVGTSMILIRPLIRANSARRFNAHVVVFFIFLVSNIGGILTPLGNAPLFLGYLQGIDFFWTTRALWPAAVFTIAAVLLIFFLVDSYFYRQEASAQPAIAEASKLRVRGVVNVALIGIVVLANAFPTGLPEGLADTFFDLVFKGAPTSDWTSQWNAVFESMFGPAIEAAKKVYGTKPATPAPALPVSAYAGIYANDYLGDAVVAEENGLLVLKLGPNGAKSRPLTHFDRDLFIYYPTPEMPEMPFAVTFQIGPDQKASQVTIEDLNDDGQGVLARVK